MMNIGNPDEAFALSFIPNDGVGLARLEFIINTSIGVHPMALVRFTQLGAQARSDVERITAGYADKPAFFVDRLAEGIATIAAAFYPKDVIVRLSDFKTNEYARHDNGLESGFRDRRARVRRARQGRPRADRTGHRAGAAARSEDWPVRARSQRLSGIRTVSRRVRDRQHLLNADAVLPTTQRLAGANAKRPTAARDALAIPR
jgi:phosphoenolpyruvate synthase/pyruvate phosphate dikinase